MLTKRHAPRALHTFMVVLTYYTLIVDAQDPRYSSVCKEFTYSTYYRVTTTAQLLTRLANAVAGDMIELQTSTTFHLSTSYPSDPRVNPARGRPTSTGGPDSGGTQTYNGVAKKGMMFQRYGTATKWITVCGPRSAVIDGSDNVKYNASTLSIISSKYIRVAGFTLQWALKTIDVQNSTYIDIYKVNTRYSLQENIRLRYDTMYSKVRSSLIQQTGWAWKGTGEGIYIGTSTSNSIDIGGPEDHSNYNKIYSNTFNNNITSENVDVKECTSNGEIYSNSFDGSYIAGINGGNGWVAVKGNNWLIHHNRGYKTISNGNGFKTNVQVSGWGYNNRFTFNNCTYLPSSATCVQLYSGTQYSTYVGCIRLINCGSSTNKCNYDIVRSCSSTAVGTISAAIASPELVASSSEDTNNGKPVKVSKSKYRYDETY